jgi:3-hydroxybutyryl-CoA dehydrogenase
MKTWGCRRRQAHKAVVPHLGAPTMKKSGRRPRPSGGAPPGAVVGSLPTTARFAIMPRSAGPVLSPEDGRDANGSSPGSAIRHVGVVGAGVIGAGVAQCLAQTGHRVTLVDVWGEALERAHGEIRQGLRLQRLLTGVAAPADAAERIRFATDPADLAAVDFVIENITEDWEAKRALYARLDSICPQGVVFAANTSTVPITRIAAATGRPAGVVGLHFMNPVPLIKTVELIRGRDTSDQTVARTHALLQQIGKEAIEVKDSPGFASNRVLMLAINEAVFLVHEGVATAADVDRLFKECFGHKMGPLETADLIGLDTVLLSIDALEEAFGDAKYRACPLLRSMVDAGLRGRKSGRGFHVYG